MLLSELRAGVCLAGSKLCCARTRRPRRRVLSTGYRPTRAGAEIRGSDHALHRARFGPVALLQTFVERCPRGGDSLDTVGGMFRAVEMFCWGGAAWLIAGLGDFVLGLTGGDPRADQFTAGLAVVGLGGFACGLWWVLRRLARVTAANVVEASVGRRALRIAIICAGPAILLLSGALYPSANTWFLGVAFIASGVVQLNLAARVARLERRHGAEVLQHGSGDFFLAR